MAKLRHVAMVVGDIEKTAQFYEQSFEMKRVRQTGLTCARYAKGIWHVAVEA